MAQTNPPSSSARSVLGLLLTTLGTFPIRFAVSVLIARVLGPADRGAFAFLVLLADFWLPFFFFGLGGGTHYYISSRKYAPGDILATVLPVAFVIGCVNALVLFALWKAEWLGKTAATLPPSLTIPVLAVIPLYAVTQMCQRVLLSTSWFSAYNALTLGSQAASAVLLTVLVFAMGLGLEGAVAAKVGLDACVCVVLLALVFRHFRPRLRLNLPFLREAFSYGLKVWVVDLSLKANCRLDHFILGVFAPPGLLGLYTVAVRLSELLWMVTDMTGQVLFNRVAGAPDQGERIRLVEQIHRALLPLAFAGAAALLLLGGPALAFVYGEAYVGAVPAMMLLLPGTVAITTVKVLTKYFGGAGSPGASMVLQVAGLLLSCACYPVLIPRWGIEGAALASSIVYTATALMAVFLYRRMTAPRPSALLDFSRADLQWGLDQARRAAGARLGRRKRG
jgi:O-antigen/teichoic acid export membrane protein